MFSYNTGAAIDVAREITECRGRPALLYLKGYTVASVVNYDTVAEAAAAAEGLKSPPIVLDPARAHNVWFLGQSELTHISSHTSREEAMLSAKGVKYVQTFVTGPVEKSATHIYASSVL